MEQFFLKILLVKDLGQIFCHVLQEPLMRIADSGLSGINQVRELSLSIA